MHLRWLALQYSEIFEIDGTILTKNHVIPVIEIENRFLILCYEIERSHSNFFPFFMLMLFFFLEPTTSIFGGPDIHVHEGSPVNLSCLVSQAVGQPEFFFWYHNGQVREDTMHFVSWMFVADDWDCYRLVHVSALWSSSGIEMDMNQGRAGLAFLSSSGVWLTQLTSSFLSFDTTGIVASAFLSKDGRWDH